MLRGVGAALVMIGAQTLAAVPSATDSLAAQRQVSAWVRAGAVPEEPQRIDPSGTTAAAVFLRLAGDTMGKGVAIDDSGAALWTATRRAWAMVSDRAGAERDALRSERQTDFAQSLTVEVQIAGEWTPIPRGSYAQAAARVLPGIQGVAVRAGTKQAVVFPGEMLSTNTNPAEAIAIAASAVDLPPSPLEKLIDDHAAHVYVFDVVQVGQIDPRGGATFFHRGGRVTPLSAVTTQNLRALADAMVANLRARLWPGDEPFGLMGTYRPWIGDYEPPVIASTRDQALAAYALARAASVADDRAAASATARRVLESLAEVGEGEEEVTSDPVAAALFVLAADTLRRVEGNPPVDAVSLLASRCVVELTSPGVLEGLEPAAGSVAAFASASVHAARTSGSVSDAVRVIYKGQTAAQLPGLMPWAGWAEVAVADDADAETIPSAVALREMRRLVHQHQITPTNFGSRHPDLVGGVVFTAGSSPLPSWQCLRPLAFLATMLRDERLTDPEERAEATAAVVAGLRFVMELTLDEADAHQFPRRDALLGGVRSALWDSSMPLDATAMALLFVCESIESFEANAPDE